MNAFQIITKKMLNMDLFLNMDEYCFYNYFNYYNYYNYYQPHIHENKEIHFFSLYFLNMLKNRSKYKSLDYFLTNPFLSEKQKKIFMHFFSKIQKMYFGFSKLAKKFRYKRATIKNKEDLSMNPIDPNNKNVVVFQVNSFFVFRVSELINLFIMSLTNNYEFFMEPKKIKNPYNNIPFNLSTLYYIYFSIKNSTFIMPEIIHAFFMCNFDLFAFKKNKEMMLREYAIKEYIFKSHDDVLYPKILLMLKNNVYTRKLKIDNGFPKNVMVKKFRTLLWMQYRHQYSSISDDELDYIEYKLVSMLRNVYEYNPKFGRKIIKIEYNISKPRVVTAYEEDCGL